MNISGTGREREGGLRNRRRRPSARLLISFAVLYLSVGFLLTFLVRWPQVAPDPAQADFLSVVFNAKILFSALSWPYWLLSGLL